jgi:hypothetical protein
VRDEVVGLPRVVAGIAGDRDGRARPRELIEQGIGQGEVCACHRDLLRLDRVVRRTRIVALDGHKNAALPECSELTLRADEALGSIRRDR